MIKCSLTVKGVADQLPWASASVQFQKHIGLTSALDRLFGLFSVCRLEVPIVQRIEQ